MSEQNAYRRTAAMQYYEKLFAENSNMDDRILDHSHEGGLNHVSKLSPSSPTELDPEQGATLAPVLIDAEVVAQKLTFGAYFEEMPKAEKAPKVAKRRKSRMAKKRLRLSVAVAIPNSSFIAEVDFVSKRKGSRKTVANYGKGVDQLFGEYVMDVLEEEEIKELAEIDLQQKINGKVVLESTPPTKKQDLSPALKEKQARRHKKKKNAAKKRREDFENKQIKIDLTDHDDDVSHANIPVISRAMSFIEELPIKDEHPIVLFESLEIKPTPLAPKLLVHVASKDFRKSSTVLLSTVIVSNMVEEVKPTVHPTSLAGKIEATVPKLEKIPSSTQIKSLDPPLKPEVACELPPLVKLEVIDASGTPNITQSQIAESTNPVLMDKSSEVLPLLNRPQIQRGMASAHKPPKVSAAAAHEKILKSVAAVPQPVNLRTFTAVVATRVSSAKKAVKYKTMLPREPRKATNWHKTIEEKTILDLENSDKEKDEPELLGSEIGQLAQEEIGVANEDVEEFEPKIFFQQILKKIYNPRWILNTLPIFQPVADYMELNEHLTIFGIVDVLGEILLITNGTDIIKISEMMMMFFSNFPKDFSDVNSTFVSPHLCKLIEATGSVKTHLVDVIVQFGILSSDVLLALLRCLEDIESQYPLTLPSSAALNALLVFGISSSKSLLESMIRIGIFKKEEHTINYCTTLDEMIAKHEQIQKSRQAKRLTEIAEWRRRLPNIVNLTETDEVMRRSGSYSENLAGVFFPPDYGGNEAYHRLNQALRTGISSEKKKSRPISAGAMSITSNITGWGEVELDKTSHIKKKATTFVVEHDSHLQLPEVRIPRPKVTSAKKSNANIRIMHALMTSSKMGPTASSRDLIGILGRNCSSRPSTTSKLHCLTGRDTPLRPFTSQDARLPKSSVSRYFNE